MPTSTRSQKASPYVPRSAAVPGRSLRVAPDEPHLQGQQRPLQRRGGQESRGHAQ